MHVQGIHHITAVAGNPQENWRFYTQVLGERMVKKTVNFDDPGTYHLYYGDAAGSPGTILTFFPWSGMRRVPVGNHQVSATGYRVAENSLDYWAARLRDAGVSTTPFSRFGDSGLSFTDPHGMPLEVVGVPSLPDLPAWEDSPVPLEHRLQGFHGVTASIPNRAGSLSLLTDIFGMRVTGEEGNRTRLTFQDDNAPATFVDLLVDPDQPDYGLGTGIVHHIAFRSRDMDEEAQLRDQLIEAGLQPSPHIDRDYFMSIYFREPGGILYEIATDPPGFTRDESFEELGTGLMLPRQHEHLRAQLETRLPAVPPAM